MAKAGKKGKNATPPESLADVIRRLGTESIGASTRQVALARSLWQSALGSPADPTAGTPAVAPEMWAQRALFEFLAGRPATANVPSSETTKLKALETVREAARTRLNALAGLSRDSVGSGDSGAPAIADDPGGTVRPSPALGDAARPDVDGSVDMRPVQGDELDSDSPAIS